MRAIVLNDYSEDSKHLTIGGIVICETTTAEDIENIVENVKEHWSGEDYLIFDIIKALPEDCKFIGEEDIFVVDY